MEMGVALQCLQRCHVQKPATACQHCKVTDNIANLLRFLLARESLILVDWDHSCGQNMLRACGYILSSALTATRSADRSVNYDGPGGLRNEKVDEKASPLQSSFQLTP